jgi:outer membrane lipoprotein carrier protein
MKMLDSSYKSQVASLRFQVTGRKSQVQNLQPATCFENSINGRKSNMWVRAEAQTHAIHGKALIFMRLRVRHQRMRCCFLHLLLLACCIGCVRGAFALDAEAVAAGLQRRYASVETVTGNFRQTYRAPGIEQVESGVFRLKRPALMRWEYRQPEEKLFVADGRESFLYIPQERQVTVQPLTASDLRNTPLEFLLGGGDIRKNFAVSSETELKPKTEGPHRIRLTPRASETMYDFLVLELDPQTYDLRSIVTRESTGNTSEFVFTEMTTNVKIENKSFRFKPPKGVEVIRLTNDQ